MRRVCRLSTAASGAAGPDPPARPAGPVRGRRSGSRCARVRLAVRAWRRWVQRNGTYRWNRGRKCRYADTGGDRGRGGQALHVHRFASQTSTTRATSCAGGPAEYRPPQWQTATPSPRRCELLRDRKRIGSAHLSRRMRAANRMPVTREVRARRPIPVHFCAAGGAGSRRPAAQPRQCPCTATPKTATGSRDR